MLQQELPLLDSRPLDGTSRWLVPAIVAAGALTGAGLLWMAGAQSAALLFLGLAVIGPPAAIFLDRRRRPEAPALERLVAAPDFSLVGAMLALTGDAAALTDSDGGLLAANAVYRERFDGRRPDKLPVDSESRQALAAARSMAWRDGGGCATGIETKAGGFALEVERVGARNDLLLWRFLRPAPGDPVAATAGRMRGKAGDTLAAAGLLAALVDSEGKLLSWNSLFAARALAGVELAESLRLPDLVEQAEEGQFRLISEGEIGRPLRAIHLPIDAPGADGYASFYLFDSPDSLPLSSSQHLQAMLDILPIGLALVDRDGRFLTMNDAFRVAAGIKATRPVYPGDLVVKEDKAAVADAVRRHARGPAMSGDLAVRLARSPKEPVALTIAGLRGLGDAAVLLLLKDNSEEAKLKRQVAQATKMQAIGQLAGGVAHDFNNILTAIIGHCDLMLMRHTPGDSDYDDLQQIKSNSNRAAGLTRQLLAFSRQQTLRPQVLQLPDIVADVSNLLKRLLGEAVKLEVSHGRNLGAVRADPGQLEQVIVNLAVNARDAMVDGGTLNIQTYAVPAAKVRDLRQEILPAADYTALRVSDTGLGIPPDILSKIFEPFFTTKELGKGTGLGLSTVYGIVKQSGGYIFAESELGRGASFVIYLPVYQGADVEQTAQPKTPIRRSETWGSGTVLLVEDEDMVRAVAERALSRQGYKVLTANDGEQGLEVLAGGEKIDLLISDVVMPNMDGPSMVARARHSHPDLPVLFMSGYAEEQLRKSIDIANVAFLPKPFSVSQLAEAARDALAMNPAAE